MSQGRPFTSAVLCKRLAAQPLLEFGKDSCEEEEGYRIGERKVRFVHRRSQRAAVGRRPQPMTAGPRAEIVPRVIDKLRPELLEARKEIPGRIQVASGTCEDIRLDRGA